LILLVCFFNKTKSFRIVVRNNHCSWILFERAILAAVKRSENEGVEQRKETVWPICKKPVGDGYLDTSVSCGCDPIGAHELGKQSIELWREKGEEIIGAERI
jgi:hypothetical protein